MIVYTKGGTRSLPDPLRYLLAMRLSSSLALPTLLVPLSSLSLGIFHCSTMGSRIRSADKIEAPAHPIFNKIVIIMDESVRGDYISVNDSAHSTTPFLKSANNLINFGTAISGGNATHLSRTIFGLECDSPICQMGGVRH